MSRKTAVEEMREQIALWGQGQHSTRPASRALADIIERYVDARIAELQNASVPNRLAKPLPQPEAP